MPHATETWPLTEPNHDKTDLQYRPRGCGHSPAKFGFSNCLFQDHYNVGFTTPTDLIHL